MKAEARLTKVLSKMYPGTNIQVHMLTNQHGFRVQINDEVLNIRLETAHKLDLVSEYEEDFTNAFKEGKVKTSIPNPLPTTGEWGIYWDARMNLHDPETASHTQVLATIAEAHSTPVDFEEFKARFNVQPRGVIAIIPSMQIWWAGRLLDNPVRTLVTTGLSQGFIKELLKEETGAVMTEKKQ